MDKRKKVRLQILVVFSSLLFISLLLASLITDDKQTVVFTVESLEVEERVEKVFNFFGKGGMFEEQVVHEKYIVHAITADGKEETFVNEPDPLSFRFDYVSLKDFIKVGEIYRAKVDFYGFPFLSKYRNIYEIETF